jgi:hypothetical protein
MATWSDIQRGIFAGESGGDYGALFNYQNRPDGQFSNVDLTQMTVDEALQFASPSGPYAQYVKGQVGRVATPMGAYQVVGTTLRAAKQGLGLTGNEKMTPELQDRIGKWIYKTQGTGAWAGYKGPQASAREVSQMDGQQPMQQQMPQQGPQGLMGFLRDPRTRQVLSAFSRSGVGQRLGQIAAQDYERQEQQQTANRTAQWLRTQPNGEEYAKAIEAGMDARSVYTQYMSRTKPTKDTYGLTPHFIKDDQGNVKVVQFSSTGEQKVTDLPEGYKLAKGIEKIDAGTHFELRDPVTNEVLGTVDKNVGDVEALKVTGKAEGQAKLDLPKIKSQGERTIALIDSILSGSFQNILGSVQGRVQPSTPGAEAIVGRDGVGMIVKLGQLQGTVFLQAFESLKGGGQITELEGAKAEAAAARLNRFQSPQDFAQALNELRDVIAEGMRSAERNAQSGQEVANPYRGSISFSQPTAPADGAQPVTNEQPATQSDWTDVGGGVRIRKKTQQSGN